MKPEDYLREKNNNFLLDFTGVYDDEFVKNKTTLKWIDCTDISGCNMYCSKQAEQKIGKRIDAVGIHGIHFLDSGNYHYVTKIMTDRIKRPFTLVIFDHHTDMQKPLVEGMTSCGDWALKVLKENAYLQQLILIGPDKKDINAIEIADKNNSIKKSGKLITFSAQEINENQLKQSIASTNDSPAGASYNSSIDTKAASILNTTKDITSKINKISSGIPIYISIDKDILDKQISETNWSQGKMQLSTLEKILDVFLRKNKIIGIDICGECSKSIPLPEYMEAEEKNEELNHELYQYLTYHIT